MRIKWLTTLALLWALLAIGNTATARVVFDEPRLHRDQPPAKVEARLWAEAADGQSASFLLILADQADLTPVTNDRLSPAHRRQAVYDLLRQQALSSQAPLQAWLDEQGISYHAHYLVNMLSLQGDRKLLALLAQRGDVARLLPNPTVSGIDPLESPAQARPAGRAPNGVEWGVNFVNAPRVWADYGAQGQGVVIGGADTGIAWQHPALIDHYRGWDGVTASHDYNWHDSIGGNGACPDPAVPCDDNGHGTHTIGTATGDDGAGNQVGVAPQAQWIGCRNMDRGNGTPARYTECFEFLLAPYPIGGDPMLDGDPSLGAHAINNSWYCPPWEGCDHFTLQQVVDNVRAAGILVVASAGNNGSACETVLYPIGTYDSSYSVGAVSAGGGIAPFSSRGPVTWNGTGIAKPDISAPGVDVRSAWLDGDYRALNGTSMAAPHVAAVAALLWSADPTLIGQVDETEAILNLTADHVDSVACGSNGWPNFAYGWGYVDALAAVQAVREPARVMGEITQLPPDSRQSGLLPGARLTFTHEQSGIVTTTIASDGTYSLTLPPGPYIVTVSAPDGLPARSQSARLLGNRDNLLDFQLDLSMRAFVFVPRLEQSRNQVP